MGIFMISFCEPTHLGGRCKSQFFQPALPSESKKMEVDGSDDFPLTIVGDF